jgi:hypothetical protein
MRPVNATGAKRGKIGLYPAKTGVGEQTGLKRQRTSRKSRRGCDTSACHGRFRPIENCVPSAI